jgi:hypothetical protein
MVFRFIEEFINQYFPIHEVYHLSLDMDIRSANFYQFPALVFGGGGNLAL